MNLSFNFSKINVDGSTSALGTQIPGAMGDGSWSSFIHNASVQICVDLVWFMARGMFLGLQRAR